MNERINVTRTFLPPINEYQEYVSQIWNSSQLTNQGPLLKEFESRIRTYVDVRNFHFVTNGTLALQVAIRSLGITEGEIITTPFSYVATTSAILWEHCMPVYVDIEPETYNIDVTKIEAAITKNTKAILAVHVFGNACDIESIEKIAKKHHIKVIYDAAHAFGVSYKGKSIFSYGDISVTSFHSTKLFHTIEGGGIFVNNELYNDSVELMKRFGHDGDDHFTLGTNAKASEFQAAMGLCNLKYIEEIMMERKQLSKTYDSYLGDTFYKPIDRGVSTRNYSYYPVVFETEEEADVVMKRLNELNIFPRRYFYPSLNTLKYHTKYQKCPVSENISKRILCLPLYVGLDVSTVKTICEAVSL